MSKENKEFEFFEKGKQIEAPYSFPLLFFEMFTFIKNFQIDYYYK